MSSKDRDNQKFKPSSLGRAALLKFRQKSPILAILENSHLDQWEKHFAYHLLRNALMLQMSKRILGQNHKMPKKETGQKHLVALETQREENRRCSSSHIRDAWRARFRWPWGPLQQASVRWASPRCAWARPAARPARAGTAPALTGRPPACAADRGAEDDQLTCPAGQTAHVYTTRVNKWLLHTAEVYRQSPWTQSHILLYLKFEKTIFLMAWKAEKILRKQANVMVFKVCIQEHLILLFNSYFILIYALEIGVYLSVDDSLIQTVPYQLQLHQRVLNSVLVTFFCYFLQQKLCLMVQPLHFYLLLISLWLKLLFFKKETCKENLPHITNFKPKFYIRCLF